MKPSQQHTQATLDNMHNYILDNENDDNINNTNNNNNNGSDFKKNDKTLVNGNHGNWHDVNNYELNEQDFEHLKKLTLEKSMGKFLPHFDSFNQHSNLRQTVTDYNDDVDSTGGNEINGDVLTYNDAKNSKGYLSVSNALDDNDEDGFMGDVDDDDAAAGMTKRDGLNNPKHVVCCFL